VAPPRRDSRGRTIQGNLPKILGCNWVNEVSNLPTSYLAAGADGVANMVHGSEKIRSRWIFLPAFCRCARPVNVPVDETGFVFLDADGSLVIGPNAGHNRRQRTHMEDTARASGRRAVPLRVVQMPAPAGSVSSEHGRIGSMGNDAFPPRRPFISCSSLLRSDARMTDQHRVSAGAEQSGGDLHRAPVYVSSAVLGGAMVGSRIAFGPRRK
jgi:hypothetical protein